MADSRRVWLTVEDDPSIRVLLSTMMGLWGIELLVFPDGYQAMEWLDQVESGQTGLLPELALLDIRMPGPQGYEIAERLRRVADTSEMVIVMMTAYRFDAEQHDHITQMARPDLVIDKPLPEPSILREKLESLLMRPQ